MLPEVFTESKDRVLIHDLCKASTIGLEYSSKIVGGTDKSGPKRYKGLYVMGPEFYKFMADTFIGPLIDQVGWMAQWIYQYFDEDSRLHDDGGKSIQYVIEFNEDKVVVFSVSAHRAIKACWTSLNKNIASEKEKKCLRQWTAACKTLLKTDFTRKDLD